MKPKHSKTCENCLWHWPSLMRKDNGLYRYYQPQSPFYHETPTNKCQHFEKRFANMRFCEFAKEEN